LWTPAGIQNRVPAAATPAASNTSVNAVSKTLPDGSGVKAGARAVRSAAGGARRCSGTTNGSPCAPADQVDRWLGGRRLARRERRPLRSACEAWRAGCARPGLPSPGSLEATRSPKGYRGHLCHAHPRHRAERSLSHDLPDSRSPVLSASQRSRFSREGLVRRTLATRPASTSATTKPDSSPKAATTTPIGSIAMLHPMYLRPHCPAAST
jgi:hypothetical protein